MNSDTQTLVYWNSILCFVACVIAAICGRLSRKGNNFRILKATCISILTSWTLVISGGGGGIFPSVWFICYIFLGIKQGKSGFADEGSFLYISIMTASFLLIFASFLVFSRQGNFEGKQLR